jgi:hypothetical protein
MLDVDASIPKFKSVVDEDRTEDWEDWRMIGSLTG